MHYIWFASISEIWTFMLVQRGAAEAIDTYSGQDLYRRLAQLRLMTQTAAQDAGGENTRIRMAGCHQPCCTKPLPDKSDTQQIGSAHPATSRKSNSGQCKTYEKKAGGLWH